MDKQDKLIAMCYAYNHDFGLLKDKYRDVEIKRMDIIYQLFDDGVDQMNIARIMNITNTMMQQLHTIYKG